tara:strand:+ start:7045 stop:8493 length:1449 start_codon:yes stop_codon:yes gene_type:complete
MYKYWLWIFLFISPYPILLFKVNDFALPPWSEFERVLYLSFVQSFFSASLALIFGFLGALGLLSWSQSKRFESLRTFITLPNFIPPLFVLLSVINIFESVGSFPFGLFGVVFIHVLLNVGLCAVIIERLIRENVGGTWELAQVEGAGLASFYWYGIITYLKRDLLSLFIFVFALSLTGFTVPLLAGNIEPLSLSIYLFNKLRLEGDWGQALFLALFESTVLYLFTLLKTKPILNIGRPLMYRGFKGLSLPGVAWALATITLILLLGDITGWVSGVEQLFGDSVILPRFGGAALYTFSIGMATGLLSFMSFLLLAGYFFHFRLFRFFGFYNSPSPIFLGFVFLLALPEVGRGIQLVCGLWLLFFPLLFRMYGRAFIEPLQKQIEVAKVHGAGSGLILKSILFPQMVQPLCWLSGVAAFWGAGDFALSRVLLGQDRTLALLVETLLGAYRLDMATVVALAMLLVGAVCMGLFVGAGYVYRKKYV